MAFFSISDGNINIGKFSFGSGVFIDNVKGFLSIFGIGNKNKEKDFTDISTANNPRNDKLINNTSSKSNNYNINASQTHNNINSSQVRGYGNLKSIIDTLKNTNDKNIYDYKSANDIKAFQKYLKENEGLSNESLLKKISEDPKAKELIIKAVDQRLKLEPQGHNGNRADEEEREKATTKRMVNDVLFNKRDFLAEKEKKNQYEIPPPYGLGRQPNVPSHIQEKGSCNYVSSTKTTPDKMKQEKFSQIK